MQRERFQSMKVDSSSRNVFPYYMVKSCIILIKKNSTFLFLRLGSNSNVSFHCVSSIPLFLIPGWCPLSFTPRKKRDSSVLWVEPFRTEPRAEFMKGRNQRDEGILYRSSLNSLNRLSGASYSFNLWKRGPKKLNETRRKSK